MLFKMTHPAVDFCIVCSKFNESLHFYRDVLELEVVADVEIPADFAQATGLAPREFRQVRLKAGHTVIKLMEIESPPPTPPDVFAAGVRWLTIFVEDHEQTIANLKAKGVKFLSETMIAPDGAKLICTKDPDGILIEFVQL